MDAKLILYYLSFIIGLLLAVLFNVKTGKNRGISRKDSTVYTVVGFIGAVGGAILMAKIYNAVLAAVLHGQSFTPSNMSLYGGLLFMPLMLLLPLKMLKADVNAVYSLATPGVFALLGTAKLGCFAYGCCYGVACEHGVYNAFALQRVFPVQLLESVLNFGIAFLCYALARNPKRKNVYPIGLAVYGVVRFFIQFLRSADVTADKGIFGLMDFWQVVSLIAVITGVVWMVMLCLLTDTKEKSVK